MKKYISIMKIVSLCLLLPACDGGDDNPIPQNVAEPEIPFQLLSGDVFIISDTNGEEVTWTMRDNGKFSQTIRRVEDGLVHKAEVGDFTFERDDESSSVMKIATINETVVVTQTWRNPNSGFLSITNGHRGNFVFFKNGSNAPQFAPESLRVGDVIRGNTNLFSYEITGVVSLNVRVNIGDGDVLGASYTYEKIDDHTAKLKIKLANQAPSESIMTWGSTLTGKMIDPTGDVIGYTFEPIQN